MPLDALLDSAGAAVAKRAASTLEQVDAVYDDQLWKILEHFGLLAPLERGEIYCYFTGTPLTRENVGGLVGTPGGPRLIADTYYSAGARKP